MHLVQLQKFIVVSTLFKSLKFKVSSEIQEISLRVALLGRSPMTLAFPASWVLEGKPGFNFTASLNEVSTRTQFWDMLSTCLTSEAFFLH